MTKAGNQGGEVMGPAELKPLLHLAKRKAVSCAIGMTKDKQGVILLHKRTKPRKLMAELLRQGKGSGLELDRTTIRFGRASVDGGSDSSTVVFTVNKPAPGPLRMALLAKLRPAGFQRCEIVVDEALENESEDEDVASGDDTGAGTANDAVASQSDGGSASGGIADSPPPLQAHGTHSAPIVLLDNTSATPTTEAPVDTTEPVPVGSAGQAASNNADALKGELTGLVRQIAPIIAADPSRKGSLLTLANDANARRKAGDDAGTQAGIAALRRALASPSSDPTAPAHDTGQTRQSDNGPTVPPVLGFLAPAAPALVEGGSTALLGGAGTGLLAGAGVGGMLLGPQMELQGMANRARTNAFWAAYRELVQIDPANRDVAPFVTNPGWQPGDADVQRIEAALAAAKAAKACTAGNPTGTRLGHDMPVPGPALPSSDLLTARPPPTGMPMPSAMAAAPPQAPQPLVAPDAGFEHDPDDPDEADLVASMHGRPGTEIQNAINDLRARRQGQGAGSNGLVESRQPPTAQPSARSGAAQSTPRDGVIGGKPVGEPEPVDPRSHQDKQDALRLQAASEDAMAAAGYRVERGPLVRPEEKLTLEEEAELQSGKPDLQGRVSSKKNPDARIGDTLADIVAPASSDPDQVRKALSRKIRLRQAYRLVLNLGRTDVTREQIEALLQRKPIAGLQELFIIEKNGAILRIFPEPGQITPTPQVR